MIKEKEILLINNDSYAFLYEFPKYSLLKRHKLNTTHIKKCKLSFMAGWLFGTPRAQFTEIKSEQLLIIDTDGRKWRVDHGYLHVVHTDWFRHDRVKTVISVKSLDDDTQYFVGISLVSHLGYANTIEKFKYEELLWRL